MDHYYFIYQACQLSHIRWETPAIWPPLPLSRIYPFVLLHTVERELYIKKNYISSFFSDWAMEFHTTDEHLSKKYWK